MIDWCGFLMHTHYIRWCVGAGPWHTQWALDDGLVWAHCHLSAYSLGQTHPLSSVCCVGCILGVAYKFSLIHLQDGAFSTSIIKIFISLLHGWCFLCVLLSTEKGSHPLLSKWTQSCLGNGVSHAKPGLCFTPVESQQGTHPGLSTRMHAYLFLGSTLAWLQVMWGIWCSLTNSGLMWVCDSQFAAEWMKALQSEWRLLNGQPFLRIL